MALASLWRSQEATNAVAKPFGYPGPWGLVSLFCYCAWARSSSRPRQASCHMEGSLTSWRREYIVWTLVLDQISAIFLYTLHESHGPWIHWSYLTHNNFSLSLHSPLESFAYHGPITCLSLPSRSSSTVFAGIENGIIQADFLTIQNLPETAIASESRIITLSGSPQGVLPCPATPIFLWQKPFQSITAADVRHEVYIGWDQRWTSFLYS